MNNNMENGRVGRNSPDGPDCEGYGTMESKSDCSESSPESIEMLKSKDDTDDFPPDENTKLPVTFVDPGATKRNKKKRPRPKYDKSWNSAWFEFCENTSVHGLRQIAEIQPYLLRRLLWLALVLTGTALFLYQMISGIMYYYTYPVSVNVKINYNDTIRFPAFTICNQNAFRMTVAAEHDWYFLLSDMFSGAENEVDLERYNATGLDLYDIFNIAGHDKDDLIVRCKWDGHPCSRDDFVMTMTDYGKCYTFNANDSSSKKAWRTGTEGGLQLLVNVEQYEYMPGPNQGAGLRVHLHNQEEVPLVREFGVAMPPGSHSLLGLTILVVRNLPYPHGKCDSTNLRYYEMYSKTNCIENCKQRALEDACGCKHINMVSNTDSKPFCNLNIYQECISKTLHEFHHAQAECHCPIPCDMESLELFNSIGDISGFDALNLLNSPLTASLQSRYTQAREVTQKVNLKIAENDQGMVRELQQCSEDLKSALDQIDEGFNKLESSIMERFVKLEERITFHKVAGLDKVKYIMEHDFVRGWTIIEERTLPYLTFGFFELRGNFRRAIEGMDAAKNSSEQEQTLALTRWREVEDIFLERLDIIERVSDNVTDVHTSYKSGDPLLTYKSSLDRRYDMSWITVQLLQAVVNNADNDQDEIYDYIFYHLRRINSSIHAYLDMGREFQTTYEINKSLWKSTDRIFRHGCTQFNYNIFLYKDRIVNGPITVIDEKIKEFDLLNRTLHNAQDSLFLSVSLLKTSIQTIRDTSWASINSSVELSNMYLDGVRGINKTMLAEQFTSKDMIQTFKDLELFFTSLRSGGRTIIEKLETLRIAVEDIWSNMLNEYTTKNFYAKINEDFHHYENDPDFYIPHFAYLLRVKKKSLTDITSNELEYRLNADFHTMVLTERLGEIRKGIEYLENVTNIARILGIRDQNFSSKVEVFMDSLKAFIKSTKIDESFYLNNFIQLDVFMQELSYEEIVQQPAYDMMKLLGDIGGSVGLFLGASAMTIAEVFDVLLLQTVRLCR